jgi:hypothetical protein
MLSAAELEGPPAAAAELAEVELALEQALASSAAPTRSGSVW